MATIRCMPVKSPKSPAKTGLGRARGGNSYSHTKKYAGGKRKG